MGVSWPYWLVSTVGHVSILCLNSDGFSLLSNPLGYARSLCQVCLDPSHSQGHPSHLDSGPVVSFYSLLQCLHLGPLNLPLLAVPEHSLLSQGALASGNYQLSGCQVCPVICDWGWGSGDRSGPLYSISCECV